MNNLFTDLRNENLAIWGNGYCSLASFDLRTELCKQWDGLVREVTITIKTNYMGVAMESLFSPWHSSGVPMATGVAWHEIAVVKLAVS